MFRRFAALSHWKRRLLALAIGLAIGAAVTGAYLWPRFEGMKRLRREYVEAHKAHDMTKLAALFEWDGVPVAERGRLKLSLKEELEADVRSARLERLQPGDGAPRDTRDGRMVPNLTPVCRLAVNFDGAGTGYAIWLVGKSKDGYRIVVYRPETPGNP